MPDRFSRSAKGDFADAMEGTYVMDEKTAFIATRRQNPWLAGLVLASLLLILGVLPSAHAQTPGGVAAGPLITQAIDPSRLVRLAGNTRPEAKPQNDQGAVPDNFPMPHMMLQMRRSSQQERALEGLIEQLHDPASPNFHQWLTPAEVGAAFGLATADLQKITGWLTSQGFSVNQVYPNGTVIDFSGTAGQLRQAFHTEAHRLMVNGEPHFANMSDPQIPTALAPAVIGIVSLNDFRPRPQYATTIGGVLVQLVAPADLATIYNLNPLFAAGLTGQGQTITVVEPTDLFSSDDWHTFRSTFGLSGYGATLTTTHPAPPSGSNNCVDPGIQPPADEEAIVDAEWATAAAPSAAIVVASCPNADTTTGGWFIAIENLINSSSRPAIVSMSYGECEAVLGATQNTAINNAYQQGVVEGMSIFVSAGDTLSASCDQKGAMGATHGQNVNGYASTPNNVAVGGTDFTDFFDGTTSTYWNSNNSATFGSAKSYVPEMPWNDTCANALFATFADGQENVYGFCNGSVGSGHITLDGGGGGPSNCASVGVTGTCAAGYSKPSFQSGLFGNLNDGVRDLPDVSLFSGAAGPPYFRHAYVFCYSNIANGGHGCSGAPSGWNSDGGTSFAAPIMAGIQALINQHVGGGKQGNPNMRLYALAKTEYGSSGSSACNSSLGNQVASSCIFYDVTQGDNAAPCIPDTPSCYAPSGGTGVLSSSLTKYQPEYVATPGYDYATGIGTINAYNLVVNWSSAVSLDATLSTSTSGNGTIISSPSGINCGSACRASFLTGVPVTVTATPGSGWSFSGWGGACAGTGGCTVTMNGAQSISATFKQNAFILSVTTSGDGLVTSSPAGIACGSTCSANYAGGTVVSLTQTAGSGSRFARWSGACSGLGTCILTMNATQSVSASFTQGSPPTTPLLAAVLPSSRSAVVNDTVTAFATIINSGGSTAPQCAIAPVGGLPLSFVYQTTNPNTNAVTGSANTPVDIPAGANQSFVVAATPIAAFAPVQLPFSFACANVLPAPVVTGLNTLLLSSSFTPVPDIVALAATSLNDGILHISGSNGANAFAVATVNLGIVSPATVSANTGSAALPLALSLCQTDPETGQCISAIGGSVTTTIAADATPTFAIFGQAIGAIPFDPANKRIFVQFADPGGTVRGSTSVAVETQ
jgi:hypothetical protein